MTIYGTALVMGGHFNGVGGVPALNIVLFDGYTWKSLGAGLGPVDSSVQAVIVHDGFLYAGGTFTSGIRYLARWENTTWRSRSLGLTSWVSALGTYAGHLYVGTPSGVYGPGPSPSW
jgi:hypothetical protein